MMPGTPAVIEKALVIETELEFRKWVRDELKHTRDQLGHIGQTLDLLLKMAKADEEHDAKADGRDGT